MILRVRISALFQLPAQSCGGLGRWFHRTKRPERLGIKVEGAGALRGGQAGSSNL